MKSMSQKLSENDIKLQRFSKDTSWHSEYSNSAYIYIGNIHKDLSEGDIIVVFSQYGEILDIVIHEGESVNFAFLCFCEVDSATLAVDNLAGYVLCGHELRVDHVKKYVLKEENDNRPTGAEGHGIGVITV